MKILPLSKELTKYLQKHKLEKKFIKQKEFFEGNAFHPSLETEILAPKHLRIWSFRIDKKYRAIFIFRTNNTIEILDINNHYK
ncbi:hypothetical protein A2662_04530 [Candidatus Giovannonibacteria bacterium RIFCSPHIGHO2_01_FULL_45_33]|uniref:Toxin YoeB n=1 Tax=Candidatus Giovannonibacteria bacterium RIFCSPLOWO2_01_FULL_45_34 TaxID=1798351 RepID=A0A1F5WZR3_9BACT|nr:MAG: hypothetical protein A2662_04530 [Candidatus Giovannonibacteria bacterium RIFCSPHIGHO2_01_FULL_45_33]OGF69694.1 MAG: hypothetical protein A3C73_00140 [Candidatus Giovannonibacteria bacterium RIFCSPHIGHO2_02_FULL_44_11]OGF81142.1 MAG: hypothetical protein A2930_01065 [Candidatus Giovannonibacteria bacterium RIFCSPLOWO2_01_FULL_45_34]